MSSNKQSTKDIYYTGDHEWIDFQGTVAFVGVCHFKLTGFREIDSLKINEAGGFRKKGEPIATICYREYRIDVNMPVDGKIIAINESLLQGPQHLLQTAETSGWLAKIIPREPYERRELMMPDRYRMNNKSMHVKS
jgi:glycine cleavage system H protein